ncbi:MAG TPA: YbeF family protein [Clostridiaceae bacterium]|jgi:hypothetical protein|nr:YbeF family protein [Clostridiaceae bacterium]
MNNLLLFFALPVATILLSIVLQKILNCPILVAITAFAIYLIVTFSAFNETFLIYAIVYTIIAYITAAVTRFIMRIIECQNNQNNQSNDSNICDEININSDTSNICNCLMENNTSGCRYSRKYWH